MWRRKTAVAAIVTGHLVAQVGAQTPVVFGFLEGDTAVYVRRAVEGAAALLERPGCQALLTDYADAAGQHLATVLSTSGKTPREAFARLRFVEERDAPQCVGGATLAFTQVGSQVIRIRGRYFKERFLGSRSATEIIIIHEFLHTLGLGENPPTSQEITDRVRSRCGN